MQFEPFGSKQETFVSYYLITDGQPLLNGKKGVTEKLELINCRSGKLMVQGFK